MNMGSLLLALAFACVVGHAWAQTQKELDAIRTTVDNFVQKNPIYQGMPTEFGCKENAKKWILGCLDLLPAVDASLGVALQKIAKIEGQGTSVVINGNALRGVLQKPNVTMTMDCCAPLCLLATAGCGCRDDVYKGMVALVGGDASIAQEVLKQQAQKCNTDVPALNFESTLQGTPQCSKEYIPIAKKWTCA